MPPLTGAEKEALTNALVSAFPFPADLDAMVQFKLNTSLAQITGDAALPILALRTVQWAAARGPKLTDLVVGALNQVPENPELQAVAIAMGLDEGSGHFEKIVLQNVPITDVEQWRAQMMACERAVCRIEFAGQGIGTGFLVGPNVAITNFHVFESVIEGQTKPADVQFHFDYKLSADGKTVQSGITYGVAPGNAWLIASSPVDQLDYALIRMQGKPAEGHVASQPGAPQRGFLTPEAYEFKKGDPLFIIQHPKATPLKFAPGSVDDPHVAPNRVGYDVNTDNGSSGSPCFTSDWKVVALHNWGTEQQNRGVVFSAILKQWQEAGIAPATA